ncbi:MAG: serine/threonine protein kinase [Simkaniaceae bacterium]|nr:serine/threonine protein kinase [Simkaniaceae bacterium]
MEAITHSPSLSPIPEIEDAVITRISEVARENLEGFVKISSTTYLYSLCPDGKIHVLFRERECLASGAFKRIFNGVAFYITEDRAIRPSAPYVIAKLKDEAFLKEPIELLKKVPESPFLLARPDKIFGPKGEYDTRYMPMPRLKNEELLVLLNKYRGNPLKKWECLVQGAKNSAKGCLLLHQCGLLHRDISLENMTLDGLFDYDTLCEQGKRQSGNSINTEFLPPEVLIQYCLNAQAKGEETWHFIQILRKREIYPSEIQRTPRIRTDIFFDQASDVFILGFQFARFFGENPFPDTWTLNFLPVEQRQKIQNFFTRVLHKTPTERPSMREFITFLEEISQPEWTSILDIAFFSRCIRSSFSPEELLPLIDRITIDAPTSFIIRKTTPVLILKTADLLFITVGTNPTTSEGVEVMYTKQGLSRFHKVLITQNTGDETEPNPLAQHYPSEDHSFSYTVTTFNPKETKKCSLLLTLMRP